MEKVRPGTGRESGLGHAGVRAPKVGALGDARSNCRKFAKKLINKNNQKKLLIVPETQPHGTCGQMAGSIPATSTEGDPAPGCETVCRRDTVDEATGRYLRRVLQPGAGCRIYRSWLGFRDNREILCVLCVFAV